MFETNPGIRTEEDVKTKARQRLNDRRITGEKAKIRKKRNLLHMNALKQKKKSE